MVQAASASRPINTLWRVYKSLVTCNNFKGNYTSMKSLLLAVLLLLHFSSNSQSPYLSVRVKMDSAARDFTDYRISMKICEPLKMTKRGDIFKPDTSSIDFVKLKPADISCGHYSYIEGPDDYAGSKARFNEYEFGNQVFAWEKMLVFRIADYSSRGWHPEMYIIVPVKYKAFVTLIDITGIAYEEGTMVFADNYDAKYDGMKLRISLSLKDKKGTDAKRSGLLGLLEEK